MEFFSNLSYDEVLPRSAGASVVLQTLDGPWTHAYLWYHPLFMIAATTIAVTLLGTYLKTWHTFVVEGAVETKTKTPSTLPYILPYIGNALSFGLSPSRCVVAATQKVGPCTAYGLKLMGNTLYFIAGRENIKKIQKYQGNITDPGIQTFCLIRVFGMAKTATAAYDRDDSGIQAKPTTGTSVTPNNRIDFHTHANFVKMLSGDGLNTLFQRWYASFTRRLTSMDIGNEWFEGRDFEKTWMLPLTAALNEAMAGEVLEHVSPTFTEEFIEFLPYVHKLFKGYPEWCIPRGITLRNRLNEACKTWHSIARACFKSSDVDASGADRWWGVPTMRERQSIFGAVDGWDHDAKASSDFGLLWGANINVHTAAVWMIVEIFRNPELLARVRAEVESINTDYTESTKWIEEVMGLPLLQSVYAEVLRLRVDVQTVFRSNHGDFNINEWRFPEKSLLLVPTRPAHRDTDYWNTRDGKYPLDRFWADRFLAFPDDAESGPARPVSGAHNSKVKKNAANRSGGAPKFVSAGTTDSWIPYGVGERACPGRFFARREISAFCAMMVRDYEVELPSLDAESHVPNNDVFYGLGVQRPRDRFAFRMRRRVSGVSGA